MESDDEALNINSLPEEMLINIFSYLSQNELGQIAGVCRRWNLLTKSPALWKKVNVIFFPRDHFKDQTVVLTNFVNLLPPSVTCIRVDFRWINFWGGRLFFEVIATRLQEKCPHLKMLFLKDVVVNESIPGVINLCTHFLPNVKILIFLQSVFLKDSTREFCDDSKIEILHIYNCFSKYLENPPFSRMPCLKQLRLPNTCVGYFQFEDDLSFDQLHVLDIGRTDVNPRVIQAIQRHGRNMKELYFCYETVKDNDLNINNVTFPCLKTICLVGCYKVTCEGIVSLVQTCQSLQNVYVRPKIAALYAAHPFTNANKSKLEIVKGTNTCYKHGGSVDYLETMHI